MSFGTYIANGFRTLLFDAKAVAAIRKDQQSKSFSLWLTALTAVAFGLLLAFAVTFFALWMPTAAMKGITPAVSAPVAFIVGFVLMFVGLFISAGVTHLFARLFDGNATITQYYGTLIAASFALFAFQLVIKSLFFIPLVGPTISGLIGFVYSIYTIVVVIFVVRETYRFSTGRAVASVLIPTAIAFIIAFVVIFALVFSGLGAAW